MAYDTVWPHHGRTYIFKVPCYRLMDAVRSTKLASFEWREDDFLYGPTVT